MGNSTSIILRRVGINYLWNSFFVSSHYFYYYKDLSYFFFFINKYFLIYFNKRRTFFMFYKYGFVYSHVKVFNIENLFIINLYFFDLYYRKFKKKLLYKFSLKVSKKRFFKYRSKNKFLIHYNDRYYLQDNDYKKYRLFLMKNPKVTNYHYFNLDNNITYLKNSFLFNLFKFFFKKDKYLLNLYFFKNKKEKVIKKSFRNLFSFFYSASNIYLKKNIDKQKQYNRISNFLMLETDYLVRDKKKKYFKILLLYKKIIIVFFFLYKKIDLYLKKVLSFLVLKKNLILYLFLIYFFKRLNKIFLKLKKFFFFKIKYYLIMSKLYEHLLFFLEMLDNERYFFYDYNLSSFKKKLLGDLDKEPKLEYKVERKLVFRNGRYKRLSLKEQYENIIDKQIERAVAIKKKTGRLFSSELFFNKITEENIYNGVKINDKYMNFLVLRYFLYFFLKFKFLKLFFFKKDNINLKFLFFLSFIFYKILKKKGKFLRIRVKYKIKVTFFVFYKIICRFILNESDNLIYIIKVFYEIYYYYYFRRLLKLILKKYYFFVMKNISKFFEKKLYSLFRIKSKVNIYNLAKYSLIPSVIKSYFKYKLKRRFPYIEVSRPFLYAKNKLMVGFFSKANGRFTKKQRASHYKKRRGILKLNNYKSIINYVYFTYISRFGICGLHFSMSYRVRFLLNKINILKTKIKLC